MTVDAATIPSELQARAQWVVWKGEPRADGRLNKIPYSARTHQKAASTRVADWAPFPVALGALRHYTGVGFVFSPDDPYTGIDLDHCVSDGVVQPDAAAIVAALDTYTEVSPSGTGVKLILRGTLPDWGKRAGPIEMYDRARFFTITGRHLAGTPTTVNARQEALSALHTRLFGAQPPLPPIVISGGRLSVEEAIDRLSCRMRDLLERGGCDGYPSGSEADAAVACALMGAGLDPESAAGVLMASVRGAEHRARKRGSAHSEEGYWRRTTASAAQIAAPRTQPQGYHPRPFTTREPLADVIYAAGVPLLVQPDKPFAHGPCPFCGTVGALWVHLERPCWGCHSCHVKGDAALFVEMMRAPKRAA